MRELKKTAEEVKAMTKDDAEWEGLTEEESIAKLHDVVVAARKRNGLNSDGTLKDASHTIN